MNNKILLNIFSVAIIGSLISFSWPFDLNLNTAEAQSSSNVSGYAWSDNIGWISMRSTTTPSYGVSISESTGYFSGYAWSDNIGWIDFAPTSGFPSAPYSKVRLQGGSVSGWARALSYGGGWDGWIKFDGGSDYGVTVSGNSFSGYAWGSDVVGWIDFSGVIVGEAEPVNAEANNDTTYVNEGSFVNVGVLNNDLGDGIYVLSVTNPTKGSVVNNSTSVRYINSAGTGTDSFTYTIKDNYGNEDTATVTVNIYDCGDGVIQSGESCDAGASNGVCPATCSLSCATNNCTTSVCGNSACETGETFTNCPVDCSSTFEEF